MIAEFLIKCFLSCISWLLGFFPDTTQQQLYVVSFEIYGYGVYLLGESFYNWLIAAIAGTTALYMGWFGAVFIYDKVRGAG